MVSVVCSVASVACDTSVASVASVTSVECGLYQYLLVTIGCPGLLLITTFDCTHSHSIITLILVGIIVIIIHILSGIFACCLLNIVLYYFESQENFAQCTSLSCGQLILIQLTQKGNIIC